MNYVLDWFGRYPLMLLLLGVVVWVVLKQPVRSAPVVKPSILPRPAEFTYADEVPEAHRLAVQLMAEAHGFYDYANKDGLHYLVSDTAQRRGLFSRDDPAPMVVIVEPKGEVQHVVEVRPRILSLLWIQEYHGSTMI